MLKAITSVSAVLLFVKIIGFIKQAVIAAYFGATGQTDIYMLVSELVESMGEVLFSSISITFLTMYAGIYADKNELAKRQFVSNTVFYGLPVTIILMIAVYLFSPQLAHLLAPGYYTAQLSEVAKYLKLMSIGMVTMFISAVCRAILDAEKHFIPPKLEGLIKSIITIAFCVFLGKSAGVTVLIYSLVIYYIVTDIYLIANVRKLTSLRITRPERDKRMLTLLSLSVPLFISNGSVYLHNIVDKAIGSTLDEGSISILSYSGYLTNTIHSLVIGSVCTVLLSYFSTYVAEKNNEELRKTLKNCIRILLVTITYIVIMISVSSKEIVTLVYGRGAFDETAVKSSAIVLVIYGVGLIFTGIRDVLIRVHYAYQDTMQAMINGVIGMLCNIALSLLLAKPFGVYGIAAATVAAYFVTAALSAFTVKKHVRFSDVNGFIKLVFQLAAISAVVIAIGAGLDNLLGGAHYFIRLIVKCGIGTTVYFAALLLLKNKEMTTGIKKIKERIGRC